MKVKFMKNTNRIKMKKDYESPKIDTLEIRVECGFAGSGYMSNDINGKPGWGWGDGGHIGPPGQNKKIFS